jgi:hypothetical protein
MVTENLRYSQCELTKAWGLEKSASGDGAKKTQEVSGASGRSSLEDCRRMPMIFAQHHSDARETSPSHQDVTD